MLDAILEHTAFGTGARRNVVTTSNGSQLPKRACSRCQSCSSDAVHPLELAHDKIDSRNPIARTKESAIIVFSIATRAGQSQCNVKEQLRRQLASALSYICAMDSKRD